MSSRPDNNVSRESWYKEYLKAELKTAGMYRAMAEVEKDPGRSEIFQRLVTAGMGHASRWAERLGINPAELEPQLGGFKTKVVRFVARVVGTDRVVPWLVRGEAKDIRAYAADPETRDLAREKKRHARVLMEMTVGGNPLAILRGESGVFGGGSGSLRAAVLGINDGLVSNFSLVMGVAGGTNNADFVLLAGVAGLLAGAFSMAAGEYVSMRSQRDVYEHQIQMEAVELKEWPEEREEELVLIYQAKGLGEEEAQSIAKHIMARPQVALETMAREELGLDPSQLGSPWGAAISSLVAFVAGALVPIFPYVLGLGDLAFGLSAGLSACALVLVGGALAFTTGRNVAWGGLRMFLAGGAAAAVTFGIGRLIGVSVIG